MQWEAVAMQESLKVEDFYDIFREITRLVHSSTSVSEVLELVVWKIAEAFDAKGAIVRIVDVDGEQLALRTAFGVSEQYLAKGPVLSNRLVIDLCREGKVMIIEDVLHDPRIQYPKEAWEEGIRMMVGIPLTLRENVIGIIRLVFSEQRSFTGDELDFLLTIGRQCACAIEKARLFEEQQNRYELLALQTEKLSALGRMAAGIAHEINNPLSGILLYGTNLKKKAPENSPLKEGLDIIVQETIRCRSIIQDLLEFARSREPRKAEANLNAIIERALSLLENEFRLKQITVHRDLLAGMPDTLVDANQMQQVIINLLVNAEEAISGSGVITVRTSRTLENNRMVIEIEDNGCGIPAENQSKIFEPFFSTKSKGTGLGLAVSYGIVRNHQGDMQVFSEPGEGTRFVIQLPIFKDATSDPRKGRIDEVC
jgi:two-component system, NtrC family, sensor kinase